MLKAFKQIFARLGFISAWLKRCSTICHGCGGVLCCCGR